MDTWIPFYQSLIWPIFIIIIFILFKDKIQDLFLAIKKRIESGSGVSVGPGGFTLGTAPSLDKATNKGKSHFEGLKNKKGIDEVDEVLKTNTKTKLFEYFSLVHSATLDEEMTSIKDRKYFRIIVRVNAYNEYAFDKIERVVYHLHPTFPNPERVIKNRKNHFELETVAWGQFNLSADVYFKGKKKPLILFRYINF